MTDDRHDQLLAELEAGGWLAMEYHQRHDHYGNIGLVFGTPGEVQIGVMPIPDVAAHSTVRTEYRPHPTEPGKEVPVSVSEEYPAVKGIGYFASLDTPDQQLREQFPAAAAAVRQMASWRDGLPLKHQHHLTGSGAKPKASWRRRILRRGE